MSERCLEKAESEVARMQIERDDAVAEAKRLRGIVMKFGRRLDWICSLPDHNIRKSEVINAWDAARANETCPKHNYFVGEGAAEAQDEGLTMKRLYQHRGNWYVRAAPWGHVKLPTGKTLFVETDVVVLRLREE